MKVLISSTSSGINLSLDEEAAIAFPGQRCQISLQGNVILIEPVHKGMLLVKSRGSKMYRASFRQPWLMAAYPKHGLITFDKEDFLIPDAGKSGFKLMLPNSLPPHKDLVRRSKKLITAKYESDPLQTVENHHDVNKPASAEHSSFNFGTANLVMAVGKLTLCYKVPEQELLELTFKLAHKGYAIR